MANYILNQELNGIEISFEDKPAEEVRTALKTNGFRWHKVKKVWYAKQTADRLTFAASLAGLGETPTTATKAAINLDGLGEKPDNFSFYGAELAKLIRDDLKRRGVKGVTVRSRAGYTTSITVTIKAAAEDIASLEEYKLRYTYAEFNSDVKYRNSGVFDGKKWIYSTEWEQMDEDARQAAYDSHCIYYLSKSPSFHKFYKERNEYPTMKTAFYNKVLAVFKIANQWNYDNSDSMTDYFDVGYYLDIDVKMPQDFTPAEKMTEEERNAYEEEKRQEEAAERAAIEEMQRQQEEARKAAESYEAQRKADREIILNNAKVEDLDKLMYITNLVGGFGKECNLEEPRKAEQENDRKEEALITRKVTMTAETYELFAKYLIDDFEFLAGFGGTASEDVRLDEIKNLYSLNDDQRADIKWFMNNCVAIYVDKELKLVCNPEGYSYSRYTYELTKASRILDSEAETERQRRESESKKAFYFPKPIAEQVANIHKGQMITIYQTDGWMLNSIYAGAGEVIDIYKGDYAQYSGFYIELLNGKRAYKVFIRDNKDCLIYEGIKPKLPDSVTTEKIDMNMVKLLNADELFLKVLNYYEEKPIIDTIQR